MIDPALWWQVESASDHLFEGRDTMFIILPLTLIGVGFLVYFLFAAASYALPLLAGLSASFAADHAGASGTDAILLGTAAFLLVIVIGQVATRLLSSPCARMAVVLLYAIPASVAGFQVASALLHLSGAGPWSVIAALAMALVVGSAAAKRHAMPMRG